MSEATRVSSNPNPDPIRGLGDDGQAAIAAWGSPLEPPGTCPPSLDDQEIPLKPQLELLEGILQTSAAAILAIDLQGQIIFTNDRVEQILGLPKTDIVGVPYHTLEWQLTDLSGQPVSPEQLPFREVVTGQAVAAQHYQFGAQRGETKYLAVHGMPLQNRQAVMTGVVLTIADITEQWQAEQILHQNANLYRQMFETNGAIKLLIDPASGEIVDANTAACEFYGYQRHELQQQKITDLNMAPAEQVLAKLRETALNQQHYWLFCHRLASGEIRDVEVYASVLYLHGRRLVHSIIHDITKRRQVEAALRLQTEQERLVGAIMQRIRQSLDLQEILQVAVNEVRLFLQADRVLIYHLDSVRGNGSVVVESCLREYPPLLGWQIGETSLGATSGGAFQLGAIQAIADIRQSDLDPAYVELLQLFGVAAQLLIPIWLGETPWGFLIAHQCCTCRTWQLDEIDLLHRIEIQLAVAIQQAELYQKLQEFNTALETQVHERTVQLQKALGFEAVLKRITDKVRDSLDEGSILQSAVKELVLMFRAGRCNAALYNLAQGLAIIHSEYSTHLPGSEVRSLRMEDFPEIYSQLIQGRPLQFCPCLAASMAEPTAVLACPILDNQGVLGHLWLVHRPDYEFKDREIRLVQQVANQCAIALRQSQLYQAAQAQVSELAKLNRLKDDFLSTVSHELRTPLASIRMAVQLLELLLKSALPLEEQPPGSVNDKVNHCLGILREECDREINLVSDLLTLQQLEAGTQPLTPTPILLQDWIPQLLETFEANVQAHRQTLQVQVAADLPPLIGDLFLLNRVLQELLMNACKFTPAGGAIAIAVRLIQAVPVSPPEPSGMLPLPLWQIWVSNTGIEISPSELTLIFDQFYRIPSHDPWKHGGTGLGLALVKRMVAYLGGQVRATSGQEQTTLIVELPHQSPQAG